MRTRVERWAQTSFRYGTTKDSSISPAVAEVSVRAVIFALTSVVRGVGAVAIAVGQVGA